MRNHNSPRNSRNFYAFLFFLFFFLSRLRPNHLKRTTEKKEREDSFFSRALTDFSRVSVARVEGCAFVELLAVTDHHGGCGHEGDPALPDGAGHANVVPLRDDRARLGGKNYGAVQTQV